MIKKMEEKIDIKLIERFFELLYGVPFPFSAFRFSGMLPDCNIRVSRSTSCKDVAFLMASRIL